MDSIICRNVTKTFLSPPLTVLKSISINIKKGSFVSVMGRSGSGKSTLLYAISGLDDITSGQVILEGEDIHAMGASAQNRFHNLKTGFVFQHHYLLPELTAIENILQPAVKAKQEKKRTEYAVFLMETFGIKHRMKNIPAKMSGGEMQRTAIARALIMDPLILFADEPTGNLDSENSEIVLDIFSRINKEKNTTILMVTHDAEYAKLGDREIVMVDGVISHDIQKKKTTHPHHLHQPQHT
jgi:ABC-type lipoprotein export system ATPase subunit